MKFLYLYCTFYLSAKEVCSINFDSIRSLINFKCCARSLLIELSAAVKYIFHL